MKANKELTRWQHLLDIFGAVFCPPNQGSAAQPSTTRIIPGLGGNGGWQPRPPPGALGNGPIGPPHGVSGRAQAELLPGPAISPAWVRAASIPGPTGPSGAIGGPVGVKYDSDKPRMDLLPPRALLEVAKVLSFGASKYAPGNWKRVDDLQARYTAAALRHLADHMINPNAVDEESHIDTLAHAICCLMFKLEDKLEKDQGTSARKADES
jgi:hypothetical protein